MCAGCITTMDTLVYAGVGLAAFTEAACYRLRAAADAEFAAERLVRAWERNAEFCAYMGLDPIAVLGVKPAPLSVAEALWNPLPGLALAAGV